MKKIKLKGDGMDACQWIHRGYTVTLTGTGYTPHIGNLYEAVINDGSGTVAYATGTLGGDTMDITFDDIPPGTHNVYWYFDLSGDGDCDAPATDHVWAEVWSESARRWVHADPCENRLDRPQMYVSEFSEILYVFPPEVGI